MIDIFPCILKLKHIFGHIENFKKYYLDNVPVVLFLRLIILARQPVNVLENLLELEKCSITTLKQEQVLFFASQIP